jgi:antitoxin MazE
MKTKVSKWGNSVGIRIPKHIISELKIDIDSEVEISIKDGNLVLKQKSPLDKMLDQVTPENIHSETLADQPVGKEIW